jgi:GAF domain-containing protein
VNNEDRTKEEHHVRAQETIVRQAEEIERLKRRLENERFAEELRGTLTLAATVGTVASPVTHSRLLEMIVETAAHVISAQAASLFLLDEEAQELVFEVTLGAQAEEVRKFRLPLGHGIAGLVAVSGQPMAVSDARSDPRQATDIAQSVGYAPDSILCVPLFYGDQIIGVLELLDKLGAPSFDAADMETLGLFANQAAVAIEQSRTHRHLAALLGETLGVFSEATDHSDSRLQEQARTFAEDVEEDAAYQQALELARLVHEIVYQGENEREACRTILSGFANYLRLRPESGGELVALR